MNPSLCLIHLVSGQTLQNFLPMLAFEPAEVVQIRSRDRRFDRSSQALHSAASQAGFAGRITDETIDADSPGIEETARAVSGVMARHRGSQILVNITGGTKLMSIGALQAAGDAHTSFYCDTESRGDFLPVGGPPLPAHAGFEQVLGSLTIKTVMAAHGVDPGALRSEVPTTVQMGFATDVAALRENHNDAISRCLTEIRKKFHAGPAFLAKGKISGALASPLPGVTSDAEHALLQAAGRAGLIREIAGSFYLNPAPGLFTSEESVRRAKANFKALEGGWWEMEVYRICQDSGAFIDLQSEVQAASQAEAIGESDLLGISRRQRALTFISCKVSDQHVKPLEHAFEFSRRAQEFGGTAARAVFVFHRMENADKRRQLESACKVLRSTLLVGSAELQTWLKEKA